MTEVSMLDVIGNVCEALDADIFAYFGDINDEGADELLKLLEGKNRTNCLLILATYGGDPDAAYRMARRIQKKYDTKSMFKSDGDARFLVYLPTNCKSAGTLLVLGADKIFISRDAEVGPIDIQMRKHDEVGERASGLLPSEALNALTSRARSTFLQHFRALRTDRALPFSTKLAAEVASTMTVGLFTPIFEQIDPMRLAEMERSQRIAAEYGKRLSQGNLRDDALVRLLAKYPSHSFIIDSEEMKEIFHEVEEADEDLEALSDKIEALYKNFMEREHPFVLHLEPAMFKPGVEDTDNDEGHTPDEGRPDGEDSGSPGDGGGGLPRGDGPGDHSSASRAPSASNDSGSVAADEQRDGATASLLSDK